MKRLLAGIACFVFLGHVATSQSIYSFEGFGTLVPQGTPTNFAMGGVGIGTPTRWHINLRNPAYLIYNNLSTFQVGLEVDRRKFEGAGTSGSDTEGGLRFLAYAFPVINGTWSSSFGITPYSSVNYNTFSEGIVAGAPEGSSQVSDNRGSGGLTNFYWANGFLIKKKIMVGFRANYTFGSILRESTISISGSEVVVNNINYEDNQSYRDLNVQIGLAYQHELKEDLLLNLGMTYSPTSSMTADSDLSLVRLENGVEGETVPVSSSSLSASLPNVIGLGVSLQKPSVYKIGLDFEFQGWSSAGLKNEAYNNAVLLALGAEWVPEYDDVNSYFKRVAYTIGASYQKLPYIVNDRSLVDFGINFGASLPVSGFSSLDLGFRWGQLGESTDELVKENYYKIVVGATISDRWFIKRKYD